VAAYQVLNFRQHLLSFRELNHNQVLSIQFVLPHPGEPDINQT